MVSWVLSIAGMAFLGVVIDTIIPNGKMCGFIRGIFSIFLMYIIINPLPQLFNQKINVDAEYVYEENTGFLEKFNSKKIEN